MFPRAAGLAPALKPLVRAGQLSSLCAILFLAGCASTTPPQTATRVYGAAEVAAVTPRVEMEDDGLPSQAPPFMLKRDAVDDPSEPYSPNYGGGPNPAALNASGPRDKLDGEKRGPIIPHDLPADFRRQLTTAIAQID